MEGDAGVDSAGRRIQVLVCIALSMLVRLVLASTREVIGTDEAVYLTLGRNFWEGGGFTVTDYAGEAYTVTQVPPLFPILVGLIDRLFGDLVLASHIVYVIIGSLVGIPVYLLARAIYGHRTGIYALLILATIPGLNAFVLYWGSMSEALYIFFVFWGLWAVYHALGSGRTLHHFLAGVALGLAYLSRSEGILFVLVCGLALGIKALRGGIRGIAVRLPGLTACVLAVLVVSFPYLWFLQRHSEGEVSVSGKTKLVLLAGAMDPAERETYAARLVDDCTRFDDYSDLTEGRSALDMIRDNPMILIGGSLFQFVRYFLVLFDWRVFPFFLVPFVLLAWVRLVRPGGRDRGETILLLAWAPTFVYLVFHIWYRYLLVAVPTFAIWTAAGLVATGAYLEKRRGSASAWLRWIPILCVLVPLAGLTIAKPLRSRLLVTYPLEYRTVGEWLRENTDPEEILMVRKPEIAFYANRPMAPLPNETYACVSRFARHHGVRYLVLDDYMIESRPQVKFLLDADPLPEGLELLHTNDTAGRRTKVFRLPEATDD